MTSVTSVAKFDSILKTNNMKQNEAAICALRHAIHPGFHAAFATARRQNERIMSPKIEFPDANKMQTLAAERLAIRAFKTPKTKCNNPPCQTVFVAYCPQRTRQNQSPEYGRLPRFEHPTPVASLQIRLESPISLVMLKVGSLDPHPSVFRSAFLTISGAFEHEAAYSVDLVGHRTRSDRVGRGTRGESIGRGE